MWSHNTQAAFCLKGSSPPSCQSLPFNPCVRLQSGEPQANIYSWNEPFSPFLNWSGFPSNFWKAICSWIEKKKKKKKKTKKKKKKQTKTKKKKEKKAERNKASQPRARARKDEPKVVFSKVGTAINLSYWQHTFQILKMRHHIGLLELGYKASLIPCG